MLTFVFGSFSQNNGTNVINGLEINPYYEDLSGSFKCYAYDYEIDTSILVTFDRPVVINSININRSIDTVSVTKLTLSPNSNICYGILFKYVIDDISGIKMYGSGTVDIICSKPVFPTYTAQDTLIAYNNGVNSVVSEFSEQDTIEAFYNGQLSVNTDEFYNNGYTDGQSTCTTSIGSTSYDIGLSIYPNPVNKGSDVMITCTDFDHFDLYNVQGQLVLTSKNNVVSTYDIPTGVYVMNVWDKNKNINTSKVLVK